MGDDLSIATFNNSTLRPLGRKCYTQTKNKTLRGYVLFLLCTRYRKGLYLNTTVFTTHVVAPRIRTTDEKNKVRWYARAGPTLRFCLSGRLRAVPTKKNGMSRLSGSAPPKSSGVVMMLLAVYGMVSKRPPQPQFAHHWMCRSLMPSTTLLSSILCHGVNTLPHFHQAHTITWSPPPKRWKYTLLVCRYATAFLIR